MLIRLLLLALMLAAGLSGARAQSLDAAFPPNDIFRMIAEPIRVGSEGFSSRLDKIRAEGREPLGLVLAGGSARAYAHIGVLQELEKAGIRPDFIVANSMGAVVGMLYAAGISPDMIAKIVSGVPPESYFSLILPTKGGLINADPFAAAVEDIVGHLDLSETQIPIIVTAEDLRSRRQVELSAGNFAKVMATTFAMPSIFEPVPFDGYLLVDGGTTNLVPAGIAAQYSSLLIVSTAFSDKGLAFDNLLSVLSRSFDIGKSRAGMKELLAASPFVIRNQVEDISYMQFASPESIIERGRASARSAIGTILKALPDTAIRTTPSPVLAELRSKYDESIPTTLKALKRGALPYVAPSIRFKLRYKLMDEFEFAPMALGSQNYFGIAAVAAAGKTRTSLSTLVGLPGLEGREWALTASLVANPFDTFRVSAEARLWGDFSDWPDFFLAPASVQGLMSLSWLSGGDDLIAQPYLNGSTEYVFATGNLDWEARAGLAFDARLGKRSPLSGAGPMTDFLSAKAGAFIDRIAGISNYGPELTLKTGIAAGGIASLRGRATGRFDASGAGLALRSDDAYRGNALAGKAPLVIVANAELVWLANRLEFDAGEILLVKDIEAGPYFDCAWLAGDGSGPMPDVFAGGLCFNATTSFAGLAPFDLSLFLGLDRFGYPVLGLRTGRLFPGRKIKRTVRESFPGSPFAREPEGLELQFDAEDARAARTGAEIVGVEIVGVYGEVGIEEVGDAAARGNAHAAVGPDADAKPEAPIPVKIAKELGKGGECLEAEMHRGQGRDVDIETGDINADLSRATEGEGGEIGDVPLGEHVLDAASDAETVPAEIDAGVDHQVPDIDIRCAGSRFGRRSGEC